MAWASRKSPAPTRRKLEAALYYARKRRLQRLKASQAAP